jgi:hypothetical protein
MVKLINIGIFGDLMKYVGSDGGSERDWRGIFKWRSVTFEEIRRGRWLDPNRPNLGRKMKGGEKGERIIEKF